ncbi:MAG: FMN-binding protein [Schaedlerella sp.]|nr:FMN-binding protein [Schaedlerella sp.]
MKIKNMLLPVIVFLGAAILLFGVSFALQGTETKNREKDFQFVAEHLLPGCTEFSEELYEGEDESIVSVYKGTNGYVVETKVAGYVDDMTVMVGVDTEGTVTGLVVMDMAETYGLGQRALDDVDFLSQFLGTKGNVEIGADVDAMSGATVTSKSLAKAVNSASAYVTGADVSSSATEW